MKFFKFIFLTLFFAVSAVDAAKDPLAGYSSRTLFVAAAKNFVGEVQQGSHNVKVSFQKKYASVANECAKLGITDAAKAAGIVGWCALTQIVARVSKN
jgi:hypothetical protein